MNKVLKGVISVLGVVGMGALTVLVSVLNNHDSDDLLKNATDDELNDERERVRLDYCNPSLDDEYRISCYDKLKAFDDEMSRRAWCDEEPHAPSRHREHGWYLSNED